MCLSGFCLVIVERLTIIQFGIHCKIEKKMAYGNKSNSFARRKADTSALSRVETRPIPRYFLG